MQKISVSNVVGTLRIDRSEKPTKNGLHYWIIGFTNDKGQTKTIPVWSSEIPSFVTNLQRLSDLCLDTIPELQDGLYPLIESIQASGGLGWFIFVKKEREHIVLRRVVPSFSPSDQDERIYTTYFNWSKSGKFLSEVRMPAETATLELLADFAKKCRKALDNLFLEYATNCDKHDPKSNIPNIDLCERLSIRGSLGNRERSQLAECGLPNPNKFRFSFLPKKASLMILENCSKASTPQVLSKKLNFDLDPQAIVHLLPWTCRYSETVLTAGFFATAYTQDRQDSILAVHDKSLFASDPLMTSLLDSNISAIDPKGLINWLKCPQYDKIPIEALSERGWVGGLYKTAFGDAPVPSKDRSNALKRIARPTRALARYRWKILQLMHWHSVITANNATLLETKNDFSIKIISMLQRLAILIHDTKQLFMSDKEVCGINDILSEAEKTYWAVLSGDYNMNTITPIGQMPRRVG